MGVLLHRRPRRAGLGRAPSDPGHRHDFADGIRLRRTLHRRLARALLRGIIENAGKLVSVPFVRSERSDLEFPPPTGSLMKDVSHDHHAGFKPHRSATEIGPISNEFPTNRPSTVRIYATPPETRDAQSPMSKQEAAKSVTNGQMADRVGFEPTVPFPAHTLSKRAP